MSEPTDLIRQAADLLPMGIWIGAAPSGELVYANARFMEIMGMGAIEGASTEELVAGYGLFDPSGERYLTENLPLSIVLRTGEPASTDDMIVHRRDGGRTHLRVWARPMLDAAGALANVLVAFVDITAEREAQERLDQIEALVPVGLGITRVRDGQVVYANPAMARIYQSPQTEIVGQSVVDLYDTPAERAGFLAEFAEKGTVSNREVWLRGPSGRRWLGSMSGTPVELDGERCIMVSIVDISDLRETREQLRHALDETQLHLRELHHRVKNNLQTICSLLSLEMSANETPDGRRSLRSTRDRVEAMSGIYDLLHDPAKSPRVRFDRFVSELASRLATAFIGRDHDRRISTDLESLDLDLDAAVACGLIINELVTNALKHAFGEGGGEVRIGLRSVGSGRCITIEDDGCGVTQEQLDAGNVGFRLVRALTVQVNGVLRLESGSMGGARLVVEFPGQPS